MAFRAGAINMGLSGQYMVGASLAAMAASSITGLPKLVHLPLCLLVAALGGAAAAFVPALFKRLSGINEVITGMIANLIMPYLLTLFRSGLRFVGIGGGGRGRQIAETAYFRHFSDLTHGAWGSGTKANTAIFMAIGVALFAGWWMKHSKLGFEMRMTKANFSFAEFAGINAGRGFFLGMMLSGAIAGLEAATEVLGVWHGGGAGTINVGEKGLILSLVGAQSFIGSVIAGLTLGGLESGTMNVSWFSSVPRPLVDIVVLLVLVLCAVPGMRAFFTTDPTGSEHLGGRFTTTWR
jgi:simple sugar transport system permease protein